MRTYMTLHRLIAKRCITNIVNTNTVFIITSLLPLYVEPQLDKDTSEDLQANIELLVFQSVL